MLLSTNIPYMIPSFHYFKSKPTNKLQGYIVPCVLLSTSPRVLHWLVVFSIVKLRVNVPHTEAMVNTVWHLESNKNQMRTSSLTFPAGYVVHHGFYYILRGFSIGYIVGVSQLQLICLHETNDRWCIFSLSFFYDTLLHSSLI